jgi:hypothetical protein
VTTYDPSFIAASVTLSAGNGVATASNAGTDANAMANTGLLIAGPQQKWVCAWDVVTGGANGPSFGLTFDHTDVNNYIGSSGTFGYYNTGEFLAQGGTVTNYATFTTGDRIYAAWDTTPGYGLTNVWVRKNQGAWNATGNPDAGTGFNNPFFSLTGATILYPVTSFFNAAAARLVPGAQGHGLLTFAPVDMAAQLRFLRQSVKRASFF